MSTFLTEMVPVSLSGALGEVGNFRLWKCDQPNTVLFVAKQPVLQLDRNGKPGVAVTTYTAQQPDHSVKIIGGAATIGLNTAPQLDAAAIDQAKALVAQLGVGDPNRLRFLPLTTQKGKALLNLPPAAGASDKGHNDRDVGTPGGSLSFLANLSETGALEWSNAIKSQSRVNGDITIQYDYLRRLPDASATVLINGQSVFDHISADFKASYNGFFYGGSVELAAVWEKLTASGGIKVKYNNYDLLPPDQKKILDDLINTYAKQALQMLLQVLFAPMPEVAPAQAGSAGGIFGGANLALKWKHREEARDFTIDVESHGSTWLTDTMDISLAALFANLDPSCLTEVPAQQAFDSVVVVDADPMLSNAAVSLSWGQGHSPEAPLFTKDGGNQRYTVVSTNPSDVMVNLNAKIDYAPPRWPVIPYELHKRVGDGGNQMVIKTSQWVGRQTIFMFVRDGNRILSPMEITPDDYLILNVSFAGPDLPNPVRDSAHIDALTPIDFSYPLDPQGRAGVAKFSAFGVIGGQLVRAQEQVIPQTDTAVFILATRGGNIQLVTSQSILGEADPLAEALRQRQGRLVPPSVIPIPETYKNGTGAGTGIIVTGRTAGVEYGPQGTSLWIRLPDGASKRIYLHSVQESLPFERESKLVKIQLDASNQYAESIFVDVRGM